MKRRIMYPFSYGIIVLGFLWNFSGQSLLASEKLLVVKQVGNEILKLDMTLGESESIFKSEKWATKNVSVSPNNEFVALIETEQGTVKGVEYEILPKNNMLVLDENGILVVNIAEDVQEYTWSSDGYEIAYITGNYYEGGVGFTPQELKVVNIKTGETKKIEGIPAPYNLHWAKFEKVLYIKNLHSVEGDKISYKTRGGEEKFYYENGKKVFRYDFENGQLGITNYKDIHFSPNGKYYIHLPDEYDSEYRIYQSERNEEVTSKLPQDRGKPLGWVFGGGSLIHLVEVETEQEIVSVGVVKGRKSQKILKAKNSIFDMERMEVIKEFEGKQSTWFGDKSKLILEKEGKIVLEEPPAEQ